VGYADNGSISQKSRCPLNAQESPCVRFASRRYIDRVRIANMSRQTVRKTSTPTLTSRVERYTDGSGFHQCGGGRSFQGSGDFRDAEFFLRKALQSMNFGCSPRTRLRNHDSSS
jgi:hypothetical protein